MLNDSHRACAYYPVQEKHAGLLRRKGMQQMLTYSHRLCADYLVVLNWLTCTRDHAGILALKRGASGPTCGYSVLQYEHHHVKTQCKNAPRSMIAWLEHVWQFCVAFVFGHDEEQQLEYRGCV